LSAFSRAGVFLYLEKGPGYAAISIGRSTSDSPFRLDELGLSANSCHSWASNERQVRVYWTCLGGVISAVTAGLREP